MFLCRHRSRSLLTAFSLFAACLLSAHAQTVLPQGVITALVSSGLSAPIGTAIDSVGNVYITDSANDRIRKVAAGSGTVTTVAGNGTACSTPTAACGDGGAATSANLNGPWGIALDSYGNIFFSDYFDYRVRVVCNVASGYFCSGKIVGDIYALAGNGSQCTTSCGDGAAAASAKFGDAEGVAVDASGDVYIVDAGDSSVRIVCAVTTGNCSSKTAGDIYTFAGVDGLICSSNTATCGDGGPAASAQLFVPSAVAVDSLLNVYIADYNRIRVVCAVTTGVCGGDTAGDIYALAGTGSACSPATSPSCNNTFLATSAAFSNVTGLAVDSYGNVVTSSLNDYHIRAICEVASGYLCAGKVVGDIYTLAGNGTNGTGPLNGTGNSAAVGSPTGVALDASGNLYILNSFSSTLDELSYSSLNMGTVNVGSSSSTYTVTFSFTGSATVGSIGVLTQGISALDFINVATGTCAATSYTAGSSCTVTLKFSPLAPGLRQGAVVLYDTSFPGNVIATIYLQGIGSGPLTDFYPGTQTTIASGLDYPVGMAVDPRGNLYVADDLNTRVLKETFSGGTYTQTVPFSTGLNQPHGVALDGAGNIYIADTGNSRILKEAPVGSSYTQSVLVNGFTSPYGVTVDGGGNLYIADTNNNRVVKETLLNGSFVQTVLFTNAANGLVKPNHVALDTSGNIYIANFGGNDVLKETPSAAGYTQSTVGSGLSGPFDVAVDAAGDVYIADYNHTRVLMETPSGGSYTQSVIATSGLSDSGGVALDTSGNLYIADSNNNRVIKLDVSDPPTLSFATTVAGATSSDSPQTETLWNLGNAALNFSIPGSGNNPSISTNFSLNSTGGTACPLTGSSASSPGTLASAASCTLPISFSPTAAGSISGSLVFTDNDLNAAAATQTISLSGTGTTGPATKLAFTSGPPATLTTGGNAGTVTVSVEDAGTDVIASSTASVTLTVTGPGPYSQSSSLNAVNGVATFGLPAALTIAGTYTYTATAVVAGLTQAVATETVSGLATTTVLTPPTVSNITASGTLTAFIATVKDSNNALLTAGTVDFYDGTTLLAAVQIVSSGGGKGTATLPRVFGIGSHSVKAVFIGNNYDLTSISSTVTFNAAYPVKTSTAIGATGSVGNYTLTGTSTIYAPLPAISGTVNFVDQSASNSTLASQSLNSATIAQAFVQTSLVSGLSQPQFAASGDFNNDGNADIVIAETTSNAVFVMLGTGFGNFSAATVPLPQANPVSVVVGDFNSDGNQDMMVLTALGYIIYLQGSGTGVFTVTGTPSHIGGTPTAMVAGDFNGDGKLDLAVIDATAKFLAVYTGNGDGTLNTSPAPTHWTIGNGAASLAAGDFNGDGFTDLAVAATTDGVLDILTNTGNARFSFTTVSNATLGGVSPLFVLSGDWDNNGKTDLAVSTNTSSAVALLGQGDGTFIRSAGPFSITGLAYSAAVADFNNDGISDIAFASQLGNSGSIIIELGNGNGTFAQLSGNPPATGKTPSSVAAVDLNGDGTIDLIEANAGDGTLDAFANTQQQSATSTGVSLPCAGVSTAHSVVAQTAASATLVASTSSTTPLTCSKVPTTLTLGSVTAVTYGSNSTLSASLSWTGSGGAVPSGAVTFSVDGGSALTASCTGIASPLSCTYSGSFAGGTHTLNASFTGDANYSSSSATAGSFTVNQASQAITFNALADKFTTDPPFTVSATASSTLPVSFSVYNTTAYGWVTAGTTLAAAINSAVAGAPGDGMIYVAGGNNGSGGITTLQQYNPSTGVWTTKAVKPTQVYQAAAASMGGLLYVAGGWNFPVTSLPTNVLEIYNPATNTWTSGHAMSHLSGCGVAGAINGKLYVSTACNGNTGYAALLDVYDPVANSWTGLTAAPIAHANGVGGVINGKFYIVGGINNAGTADTTELDVYDPVATTWSTKHAMPVALAGMSGDVIDGKLYVVGGNDSSNAYNATVYIYDPGLDSWSSYASSIPAALSNAAAVSLNGALYVAGGNNGGGSKNTLQILNTNACSLTSSTTVTLSGSVGICTVAATQAGNTNYTAATSVSQSFNITAAIITKLAFGTVPATPIAAGGNGGSAITVLEQNSGGVTQPSGTDAITLTVTGPAGYTTAVYGPTNAVSGVATFSVSAAALTIPGTYTYTATTSSLTSPGVTETVTAGAATHFTVTAPSTATAGTGISVTVTAQDAYGNTATTYAGTVHFTSTDAAAVLPANSALTSGTSSFPATLKTVGSKTVTATDTITGTITGTSAAIIVSAGAVATFTVSLPASFTANTAQTATVTAYDSYGNIATGYTGTVTLSSSDPRAVLGGNAALTSGAGTFSVKLLAAGSQTVTSKDTVTPTITGSASVTVNAPTVTITQTTLPAATVDAAYSQTLTTTGGTGPYTYAVTGGALPAGLVLTTSGAQAGTISGTPTAGGSFTFTITASDSVGPYTGSQAYTAFTVNPATQTINFTAPATPVSYGVSPVTLVATGGASGNAVTFTIDGSSTGTGSISGNTLTVTGAGTLVIDANQAGNTNYTAAVQVQKSIIVNKATPVFGTMNFSPTATEPYGTSQVITISDTLAYSGPAAPGGAVTFTLISTVNYAATCSGSSSPLTCTVAVPAAMIATLPVAGYTITAAYAADMNYAAATGASGTFTITQATQTINFTAPATPVPYGVSPITLVATGGASGNAITFTIDGSSTGTGSISGNTLTVTGVGTLVIDANQAGNANYTAAAQVQKSIVVSKATPAFGTMSFLPASSETYSTSQIITISDTLAYTGSAKPAGVVTYTLNSVAYTAACSGSSSPLTCTFAVPAATIAALPAAGYTVSVASAADTDYSAATGSSGTFTITQATQTINFTAPATPVTYGVTPITLVATGGASGNAVVFTIDASSTGTGSISGNTLTVTRAGTLVLDANQAGNTNYSAATQAQRSIVVNKATPAFGTMSFSPAATEPYGTSQIITISDMLAYAGATPAGVVTYTLNSVGYTATCSGFSSPRICTAAVPAATIAALAVNGYTITAAYATDSNYTAVTGTSGVFTVTQAAQTISFTAPTTPVAYGASPVTLIATSGTSSNVVTFTIDGSSTGTGSISGSTLTVTGVGTIVIDANQAGNANYTAATQVQRSIVVNKAALTVTANAVSMPYGGPIPALTGTLTGVVGTDGITASYATNATVTSPVGNTYTVTPSLSDPSSRLGNYTVTNTSATLTITKATLTITGPTLSKVYGAALPSLSGNYSGQVNGDIFTVTGSTTATAASPVLAGGYAIVPNVTGANLADYTVVPVNGTLTITQAATTAVLGVGTQNPAAGQNNTYTATVAPVSPATSTPTGTVQFFDSGTVFGSATLVSGQAVLTSAALTPGSHSITITYSGDTNYLSSSSSSGTVVDVDLPDFSFAVSGPAAISMPFGGSASFTFHIAPLNGNYYQGVSFSYSGDVPLEALVTFSPASLNANAGPADITFTVATHKLAWYRSPSVTGGGALLCILMLPFALVRRDSRRRFTALGVALVLCLGAACGLSGCGTGYAAETYPIVITANSGGVVHTVAVTVNIEKTPQ